MLIEQQVCDYKHNQNTNNAYKRSLSWVTWNGVEWSDIIEEIILLLLEIFYVSAGTDSMKPSRTLWL